MDIKIQNSKTRRNTSAVHRPLPKKVEKEVVLAIKEVEKPKKAKAPKKTGVNSSLRENFANAMRFPDIIGPVKIPSSGGAETSFLGMDHTMYALYNTAAGNCCFAQYGSLYGNPLNYTFNVTNTSAATNSQATIQTTPGIQFPAASQVDQLYMTTGCMVIQYEGAPLNASGELIFGLIPNDPVALFFSAANNYNQLMYYPGVRNMPISQLIEQGCVRIPIIHGGPTSFNYDSPSAYTKDMLVPFMAATGLDPNGVIKVQVFRNWEVKSPLSANAIPTESQSGNFAKDLDAFQDALAEVSGSMATAFSFGFPNSLKKYLPNSETTKSLIKGGLNIVGPAIIRGLLGGRVQALQATAGIIPGMTIEDLKTLKAIKEGSRQDPAESFHQIANNNNVASPVQPQTQSGHESVGILGYLSPRPQRQ